jgi:hypothetical protein
MDDVQDEAAYALMDLLKEQTREPVMGPACALSCRRSSRRQRSSLECLVLVRNQTDNPVSPCKRLPLSGVLSVAHVHSPNHPGRDFFTTGLSGFAARLLNE